MDPGARVRHAPPFPITTTSTLKILRTSRADGRTGWSWVRTLGFWRRRATLPGVWFPAPRLSVWPARDALPTGLQLRRAWLGPMRFDSRRSGSPWNDRPTERQTPERARSWPRQPTRRRALTLQHSLVIFPNCSNYAVNQIADSLQLFGARWRRAPSRAGSRRGPGREEASGIGPPAFAATFGRALIEAGAEDAAVRLAPVIVRGRSASEPVVPTPSTGHWQRRSGSPL